MMDTTTCNVPPPAHPTPHGPGSHGLLPGMAGQGGGAGPPHHFKEEPGYGNNGVGGVCGNGDSAAMVNCTSNSGKSACKQGGFNCFVTVKTRCHTTSQEPESGRGILSPPPGRYTCTPHPGRGPSLPSAGLYRPKTVAPFASTAPCHL